MTAKYGSRGKIHASHDDHKDSILPSGYPVGTPQDALDCACGLYLNDTTTWQQPPTN